MSQVLVLGATGLLGQALGQALVSEGHQVTIVSRHAAASELTYPCRILHWPAPRDGSKGAADLPDGALSGIDAVVNLAGESIAEGRWTDEKKQRLRSSRLGPTAALVAAVQKLAPGSRPTVLVQASAVGFYGDRGDAVLSEAEPAGEDFAAQLCREWEAAAEPLAALGMRVARLRFGVVLAREGGALPKLAKLYQVGAGAAPAGGQQWFSWIHLVDAVGLMLAALRSPGMSGVLNAVAPNPVRFVALHRALTGRRHGPVLAAPAPIMRAALGEAATMVLASQRAVPRAALAAGYQFRFANLDAALNDLLGDDAKRSAAWLQAGQWIKAPLAEVAAFFADEANLEAITPPWLNFRVLGKSTPAITDRTLIRYRLRLHGVPLRWTSEIKDWRPPHGFVDQQRQGPFALWHHTHQFRELGGGTLVTDYVRYRAPLGKLGALTAGWLVDRDVAQIFAYRRQAIAKRFPGES